MLFAHRCVLLAAALGLAACGYVGEPQPPALRIPVPATDLSAYQHAGRLLISFTAPDRTTEGLGIQRLRSVDLRLGAAPEAGPTLDQWANGAGQIPVPAVEPGPVRLDVDAAVWVGRSVQLAVRFEGPSGRWSQWSNVLKLNVLSPLQPPVALAAEPRAGGIALRWNHPGGPPGLQYRIFRRESPEEKFERVGLAASSDWIDKDVSYGRSYIYSVQAAAPGGAAEAESARSAELSVSHADRFAPAVPSGLVAVAGLGVLELVWEPCTEPDLAGYRLYRSSGEGEEELLAVLTEPSYSDREITPGTSYAYRVSSVDQIGNESARSTAVVVSAPQESAP